MIGEDGGKETQRGPDVCWTVIVRTARSSPILYCLLSCSERTLKRLHICFHTRRNEGTDIKHRPRHITPTLAVPPTSTRNSAVPIGYFNNNNNKKKAPLTLGTLQKARIQNQFAVSLCHTGGSQAWLCPAAAMPGPELTPSAVQGLQMFKASPDVTLTLLRRRPPPWCSGVLVSDALLVFSLLLLGSLSLMMSYWRQKRAITPRKTSRSSQRPGTDSLPCLPVPLQALLPSPDGLCAAAASLQPLAPFPIYPGMSHPCCRAGPPRA